MLDNPFVGHIALANKEEDYLERELEAINRLAQVYALAIQRKRTEDKLKEAYNKCERLVDKKTAELSKSSRERVFIRQAVTELNFQFLPVDSNLFTCIFSLQSKFKLFENNHKN